MGQKVNPIGFRLAVTKDWRSKWYATGKDYATKLHEDLKIRKFIKDFTAKLNSDLKGSTPAISRITIERAWNSVRVTIATARPGLVIGPKGKNIEDMTAALSKLCGGAQVKLDIMEIRQPELDAQLVAENIATQLERRVSFRRAMKRAVQVAMDFGAEGIRIRCAGRLGGADIARAEQYREGKVPLQTLRAPIDYGFAEAHTLYGLIGIKCWINKRPEAAGSTPGGRPNRPSRPRRDRGERGGDSRRDA